MSAVPPLRTGVMWAAVAGWLGTLAFLGGVLVLYPAGDRAALIAGAVPAVVTLASSAGLWVRNRRTAQLVDERTNGGLDVRIRSILAEELPAAVQRAVTTALTPALRPYAAGYAAAAVEHVQPPDQPVPPAEGSSP